LPEVKEIRLPVFLGKKRQKIYELTIDSIMLECTAEWPEYKSSVVKLSLRVLVEQNPKRWIQVGSTIEEKTRIGFYFFEFSVGANIYQIFSGVSFRNVVVTKNGTVILYRLGLLSRIVYAGLDNWPIHFLYSFLQCITFFIVIPLMITLVHFIFSREHNIWGIEEYFKVSQSTPVVLIGIFIFGWIFVATYFGYRRIAKRYEKKMNTRGHS
jgi:hypothetical protein